MHKNTKLLPYQRREMYYSWKMGQGVTALAREFKVSRETVYETMRDAKLGIFQNRSSMNRRYQKLEWGLKRLERREKILERKLLAKEKRLRRYERNIPGELVHLDTKRLPLIRGEAVVQPREYLFVAIDDYSRWLFADIFPDKTGYSAAIFLEEVRRATPFTVTGIYSDNGSEYKGKSGHPVYELCKTLKLSQHFTKVKHPWTNGKAERVIRTLMEEWCTKSANFTSREHRRKYLYSYVDWYNQNRFHQSLNGTPIQRLEKYLENVNNAGL